MGWLRLWLPAILGVLVCTARLSLATPSVIFQGTDAAFGFDSDLDCRDFHSKSLNVTEICKFVTEVDSCSNDGGFVNYISVCYCKCASIIPLYLVLMFLWWLFLFVALAVTADDFFCPSLTVIAQTLRLSQNIAGVTFLAFGNGAPDIFSALAAVSSIKNGDAGLAFGALLGAGVFVTTVVAGSVMLAKPFQCMERPLLRDIIFYLGAVYLTFFISYDGKIQTIEALGFIIFYVVYVAVVIFGRYLYKKQKDGTEGRDVNIQEGSDAETSRTSSPDPNSVHHHIPPLNRADSTVLDYHTHSSKLLADGLQHENLDEVADEDLSRLLDNVKLPLNTGALFRVFLRKINPIPDEIWKESKWYARAYLIFKAPIQFVLLVTVPVVDLDEKDQNWNRYLAATQCLLGPMFSIFAINQYAVELGNGFPLYALILIISAALALLVLLTSSPTSPPKYFPAFGYAGFIFSVIWIYVVANEIVNIMQLFGVFFNISNTILGLTFLAWGNSIGDWIADTVLAKKGYPRIGISACFGGPLFNLLLGVGIPFTLGCVKNGGVFQIDFNFEQIVLTGFLALSLISTLIIVPFVLQFKMNRAYGVYLIVLYVVFLAVSLLTETGVISVAV